MDIPDEFLIHTVSVETQIDTSPYGDNYAPAEDVPCFVDDRRRLVRNSDGAEVVSETTVICKLDQAPKFVLDSKITLADGRVGFVIAVSRLDAGDLGAPSHLEVAL